MVFSTISENPSFRIYIICTTILLIKMLLMAPLTIRMRIRRLAYISKEDEKLFGVPKSRYGILPDQYVERITRAHMNDLENIPPFIIISLLYLLTNPPSGFASLLMKSFTVCRILHTVVYAMYPTPQPARGLTWMIGYGISLYMSGIILQHFL